MSLPTTRLDRTFFEQPTLTVAQELLGKKLIFNNFEGIITETEAYIGKDDPACHAARGRTKRTEVMFGPAGYSYVYFIYGMYYCLNFVTEQEGFPAAVLIRGVNLFSPHEKSIDGPGKLCRDLGITKEHNSLDITRHRHFKIINRGQRVDYTSTPRIGISKGQEKLWRFVMRDKK